MKYPRQSSGHAEQRCLRSQLDQKKWAYANKNKQTNNKEEKPSRRENTKGENESFPTPFRDEVQNPI